jgi:hypothetical protein
MLTSRLATTLLLAFLAAGCSAGSAEGALEQASDVSATRSTPTPLDGHFRFAGQVEAIGRLTVDVIDTRMADAATRLEALQADGAECPLVTSNTYRCTKMHPASEVPAASLDALGASNREAFAKFGAVTSAPSLVSEADSLVEWQISQTGSSKLGPFSAYRYLQLDGGLVKIVLPGATESQSLELILKDANHLGKWDSRTVSEGRWRFHEDMALVILEH